MTTLEYDWLWGKRVNDNVPVSSQENTRSIEKHLQVIPSELEIIKQDFEKKNARVRENAPQRDLLESQNEKVGLRAWVAELERSLHQYRSCNSAIKLKASLNKIEELKGKIEELETAQQNCKLRVELLKMNNDH
ncbi:hypothetical protein Gotur_009115 [Gossypium turneri]